MRETTLEDRKHELRQLLEQFKAHPERDWSEERKRAATLSAMIEREEDAAG